MSTVRSLANPREVIARRSGETPDLRSITVLFTSLEATIPAVAVARELGRALGAEVTVMPLQTSLTSPLDGDMMTPSEAASDRLRLQLRATGADVRFRVVVSSQTREALRFMLPRPSLVV